MSQIQKRLAALSGGCHARATLHEDEKGCDVIRYKRRERWWRLSGWTEDQPG